MQYREEVRNLFLVSDDYYLAHCISADFAMGKGIAVEFNKRYDMKNKLQHNYPEYINLWNDYNKSFDCILQDKVFNLITKEKYFHKPTYTTIYNSIISVKNLAIQNKIQKIAMPKIGCGLDRLN